MPLFLNQYFFDNQIIVLKKPLFIMKKFLLLYLLFSTAVIFSQERPSRDSNLSTEEMATLAAKRTAMQLELRADQEQALQKIYLKRIDEEKTLRAERQEKLKGQQEELAEEKDARLADRQKLTEKYNAQIKEILTAEQYTKFLQLQEKRSRGRQRIEDYN
ncbi:MAG: hypothetical protein CME35_11880 [Gramella sp.]|nr:hypothetical protein [Christiangramia sp.]